MLLTPRQEIKRTPNTITLVSMAKRARAPEADVYMDVSIFMEDTFPNDTTGLDTYVQNSIIVFHGDFLDKLEDVLQLLVLDKGLLVVIACNAGIRRSVATVEVLGRELHHRGINVQIIHKELGKWFKF